MIRRKGASWEVRVYAGRDPLTGRERYVSRSFKAQPREKVPPRRVTDAEARLKVEVRAGRHVGSDATVGQVLDEWLTRASDDLSPWTVRGYRGAIDRYLKPGIGDVPVRRLTAARVDALYDSLKATGGARGQGLDPATIRQAHAVLRRALNRAVRPLGIIDRNPALDVEPPARRARPPEQAPDTTVVDRLLAATNNPALRLLVLLAEATGARRGEIAGFRWADIDPDEQTIAVVRSIADPDGRCIVKTLKANNARRISIGAGLVALLDEHHARARETAATFRADLHPDAYILSEAPDGSAPLRPERLTGRFRALAKRAGVDVHLHELRHGHATALLSEGVDVNTVAHRLGHTSPYMTLNVYGHAIPAADRRAAEITDRR